MLEVYERLGVHCHESVDVTLMLNHEQRDKGRLKAVATDGTEIRIFLDRGKPLLVGEFLKSQCGKIVKIQGEPEPVIEASCDEWSVFSAACYHLGNRHVKIQIGERWLRITPDHVLEEMLQQLGLKTQQETSVFIPETGAYGHGHHHH
jgi:urease accessory protein